MKNSRSDEKFIIIATFILLISIILMAIIIPGVYTKTILNEFNKGAVIGITLAIIIRLLLVIWNISLIKNIRRKGVKNKEALIIIAALILLFGLIYSDGAFAFSNNKNVLYVSYLMFISVLCDIIASILTFIAAFYKIQKVNEQE